LTSVVNLTGSPNHIPRGLSQALVHTRRGALGRARAAPPAPAQLTARGKPQKVALTACMHKPLAILHAVLRGRSPWQPTLLAS
jgi:hypothetical protein